MTDNIIKILALTGNFSSPSTRLRILNMKKYLSQFNIVIYIETYPQNILKLNKILKRDFHILWLQKKMPDIFKYLILKTVNKPIIFDFDDNLQVRMKEKNGSYNSFTRRLRFQLIKNLSSGFTCGNKFLSDQIQNMDKPYFIYPTPVPVNVPVKQNYTLNSPIKIGWVGLSGGFMYLDKIFDDIKKLNNEIPIKFIVISDKQYRREYNFIENIKWDINTQEKEITNFDFGIMPLNTESPYDKGKCGYKILQYMASGVIPVAENFGTNKEIIQHKENGFLIFNKQWHKGLKEIILDLRKNPDKYKNISLSCIKTAKNKYSFESLAPNLANFFNKFIN